jgi:hypothetical protein
MPARVNIGRTRLGSGYPVNPTTRKGADIRKAKRCVQMLFSMYKAGSVSGALDGNTSTAYVTSGVVKLAPVGSFKDFMSIIRTNIQGASTKAVGRGQKVAAAALTVSCATDLIAVIVYISNSLNSGFNSGFTSTVTMGAIANTVEFLPRFERGQATYACGGIVLAVSNNAGLGSPTKVSSASVTLADLSPNVIDGQTNVVVESVNMRDLI